MKIAKMRPMTQYMNIKVRQTIAYLEKGSAKKYILPNPADKEYGVMLVYEELQSL